MADMFECGCEPIDVTSASRPDTSWRVVDAHGHVHEWYVDGTPATAYYPEANHETPTLVWVKDGEEYWEDDDEPHDVGHRECRQCGEHIEPRYTADTCQIYIAGPRWCKINGQLVTLEEFVLRVKAAHPDITLG